MHLKMCFSAQIVKALSDKEEDLRVCGVSAEISLVYAPTPCLLRAARRKV